MASPAQVPNDLMSRFQAVAGSNPAPGAMPKSPQAATPPPGPSDDMLSRFGKVAKDGTSAQEQASPQDQAEMGSMSASAGLGVAGIPDNPLTQGMAKGAAETAHSVGRVINKVTGDRIPGLPTSTDEPAQLESSNAGEAVGKVGEGIIEFVMGDEALKGLSIAGKLGIAQKLAKLTEEYPSLAKALHIGMNSVRTGTVGGVQAAGHGASAKEAVESGAIAGGTGAVAETAAGAIGKLVKKPTPAITSTEPLGPEPQITKGSRNVAGQEIPTAEKVATPAPDKATSELAADKASAQKGLEKIYSQETEPAARKAVSKVITKSVQKIDSSAPEMKTFEDAEKFYKAKAQPTYDKLDELTKGDDMSFSDMQRMERNAYRNLDFDQVDKAKKMQADVLTKHADQFEPGELAEARKNYSQGSAAGEIHEAFNSPAVVGDTPDELIANKNAPDPGMWKGKPLLRVIRKLNGVEAGGTDSIFAKAGVPKESVAQLQELGRVLTKEGNLQRFNAIFRQVASTPEVGDSLGKQIGMAITRKAVSGGVGAVAGGVVGGPVGSAIGIGAGVAAEQWLLPKIMEKMSYNPEAMRKLVTGLRSSASAAAIANAIRPHMKEENKSNGGNPEPKPTGSL